MNWKVFIAFFASGFLISFPQNIIGCGDGIDPYDYYTSFFPTNLPEANGYRPFYYTNYNFLYDDSEPVEVSDVLAREWASYCGSSVTPTDAKTFVNKFMRKDVTNLYLNIEKSQTNPVPDSVLQNSMAKYFIKSRDLEGLGYILYAMQVEPNVIGSSDAWEPVQRDTVKMARLIKNGLQLWNAAKNDFFKLKYAYQVERLAHYSGRYNDAIEYYDEYVLPNKTASVLQPLCLALKAGAFFRTGKQKEAAYLFSKAFNASVAKRISNYLGFNWSVDSKLSRTEYLEMCKSPEEKTGMLSLFAMGSTANELATMKEIFQLDPNSDALEVLVVREINKLEENYFTPLLQKEKGGKSFYSYWKQESTDSIAGEAGKEAKALATFLHDAANGKVKNPVLFEVAAAYTAYMVNDLPTAKKYLAAANKMNPAGKLKDQWTLTNILVTINEKENIDVAFEEQLLPSLEWLQIKAKEEKPTPTQFYDISQWKKIYRDLLSEILARRYHKQGELYKEALCIGAADATQFTEGDFSYGRGIDFMRNNMASKDVEQLYAYITNKQADKFRNFLVKNNSLKESNVTDFAGTAYLREYDYSNAIQWFKKVADKKEMEITTNPFADLLYDQEEQLASEANFKTNKLAFAETMLQLQKAAESDKPNAAKHYYKIATGLYNITYYGHAWKLVQYERSGSDGYAIPKDATPFQKEYYGCFSAHDYFQKAMAASTDKNFKARCLFMMAKCSQKQVQRPRYADFNYDWNQLEPAEKTYWTKFTRNKYFPQLMQEYSSTPFYKQAYNSCSYLRDFVKRK
jgi:hypothetical protein